jgi:hypothetical protein
VPTIQLLLSSTPTPKLYPANSSYELIDDAYKDAQGEFLLFKLPPINGANGSIEAVLFRAIHLV